ncbi:unnamed protein product [Closterium sp. Yama58-4]|nr:unnamed protein product [Closterium sp. Yama58-4]
MSSNRRTLANDQHASAADEPRAPPQSLPSQGQLDFSSFFPALVGGGVRSAAIAAAEAASFPAMASATGLDVQRPIATPRYLCDSGSDAASLNSETLAFLLANPAAALATLSHTSPSTQLPRNSSHTLQFGGAIPTTGPSQHSVRHASLATADSLAHLTTRTWLPQHTAMNGGASGARSGVRMASSPSDSIAAAASALNHNFWRPVDSVDQRAVDWAGCDVPALSHLLLLEQMRQMRQMEQGEQINKAAADSARRGETTGGGSERTDYGSCGAGVGAGGVNNAERTWETIGSGEEPAAGASNGLTAADAALLSQLRSAHDSLPRPSFQSPTAPRVRTPASGGDACWEASEAPGAGFREPRRLRAPDGGSCGLQLVVAEQLNQLQREERRDSREAPRDSDLGTRRGATGEQRESGRYDHRFERAVGTEDTCPAHARPSPLLFLTPGFRNSSAGDREGGVTVDGRSTDGLAADLGLASQLLVDGVAISNSGDASGSRGQQNLWSPSNTQSRSGNDWGLGGREERSRSGGGMAPPTRPASAAITSANARAVGATAAGAAAAGAAAGGASAVAGAGDSTHRDPHEAAPAGQVPRGSRSKSVGQMQAARILQALEHGARERARGGAQGRNEGEAERRRKEQERVAFDWSEKGPRSHSEAEKRRRERINQQLNVLRALLPGARMGKADKASVLAEAVAQLRALKAGLEGSCGEGAAGATWAAAGLVGSSLLACGRVPEATPREDDAVEVDLVWAHVEEEGREDGLGEEVGEEQEEEQGEMVRRSGEGLTGRKRRRGSEGERAVCVCIWCEDGDGLLPAIEAALKPFPLRLASLESASCASRVAHMMLLHACPSLAAATADTGPAASCPVAPDFKSALAARPPGAASATAFGAPGQSAAAAAEQEQQHEGVGRAGAEVYECGEDASQAIIAGGEGGVAQYVREVRAVVVDVMARWRRGELVSGGV